MVPRKQRTRSCVIVALVVVLAGLAGGVARADGMPVTGVPVPELADFDSAMLDFMSEYDLTGGVLAVSVDGCVVYQRGFGWREFFPVLVPLPENTPMRLASVEKPLTAAVIRKLADLGYFSLGDYVFDLEQPFGGILQIQPWQGIGDPRLNDVTVRHLLLHTGGWSRDDTFDPQFEAIMIATAMGISSPPGRENTVRYMLSQPLQFVPGTLGCTNDNGDPTICYSNFGYMVLGLIVEHFLGPRHVDAIRELVLTPEIWVPDTELFLGRTFATNQSPREPRYLCTGCQDCRNVFDPAGPLVSCPYGGWDHESMAGHGNLVAGAAPLLTFLDHYAASGYANGDSMIGMELSSPHNGGHTGGLPGTSTVVSQRDDGVNVVVLFNERVPDDAPDIAAEIFNLIGDPPTVTWPTLCVDGSWVDFNAPSSGYGGYDDPFHTMNAALAATSAGVKLRVKPGTSNWTGTLSMRMRIDAPFGLATIGQ